MTILYRTFQCFFTPLVSIVFFLLFLFATHSLQADIFKRFKLVGFTLLILVISDAIQYYCEGLSYVTTMRMVAAAVSYICRPSILYYELMIYLRRKTDNYRYMMSIPLLLTAICAFAAFFTKLSFYYTPDNILVRGPLISMPFIASFFYFVLIMIESVRNIRLGDTRETTMLLMILFAATIATYLEAVWRFSGLLSGFSIVSAIMYYLFFMIDNYAHDQLTGAYRRERMYQDFRAIQKPFGVIIFDINDLKKINDIQGHVEGDKAISTIAHTVESHLLKKTRLYRIGGDEFVIVGSFNNQEGLSVFQQKIYDAVMKTGYSIAIGSSFGKENDSLETVMSQADKTMYEMKRAMKATKE